MIERANATIKELIQKSLEINPKCDWAKKLDKLIEILIIQTIELQDIHQMKFKKHTRMMIMLY